MMRRSTTRETEIKLRFSSAAEARKRLEHLGARETKPRIFEDNVLFDRARDPLRSSGRLLRLRRVGDEAVLTVKAPVSGVHRHKVREEHETRVEDPDALERILDRLDFASGYRYQKFRTEFAMGELCICLDETPVGCFVELEGQADEIDRVAGELGFSLADYELASYREIHTHQCAQRGEEPGDMLLERDS